jgi:serine dehydrogenase proteinase
MATLKELVEGLATLRVGIPQFLFADSIWFGTTLDFRRAVIEHKKTNAADEIDFIIHSPGGSPADAYRIIRALRGSYKTVNVVVPFWAKSAATLLSLGASKIIFNDWAEFGPIDMQVAKAKEDSPNFEYESALNDEFSLKLIEGRAQDLFKKMFVDFHTSESIPIGKNDLSVQLMEYIPNFFKPLLDQVNPYKLGAKKRQLDVAVKYANRILVQFNSISPQQRRSLIDYLLNECPEHGYVVDFGILSVFLPNIVKSFTLGPEYEAKLDELSFHCMEASSAENFVGFVDPPTADPGSGPDSAAESANGKAGAPPASEDSNGQTKPTESKPRESQPATKTRTHVTPAKRK